MRSLRLLITCLGFLCLHCAQVRGNGAPAAEDRNVGAFDAIQNEINVDVVATIGSPRSVHVSCDSNLVGLIHTTVSGQALVVSLDNGTSIAPAAACSVALTMPTLTAIVSQGSGGITVNGDSAVELASVSSEGSGTTTINAHSNAPELHITNDGSGSVELAAFLGNDLVARVDGSGPITIAAGQASSIDLQIDGSGDFTAAELGADECDLQLDGSGNAELRCTARSTSTIRGSGSATIFGTPAQHEEEITGSGAVHYR